MKRKFDAFTGEKKSITGKKAAPEQALDAWVALKDKTSKACKYGWNDVRKTHKIVGGRGALTKTIYLNIHRGDNRGDNNKIDLHCDGKAEIFIMKQRHQPYV